MDTPQQNGSPSPAQLPWKRQLRLPKKPCLITQGNRYMDEQAKRLWELKRDEKERRNNKVSKFNRKVIVPEVGMRVLM